MSAVELLWQPHLAELLGGGRRHGFEFVAREDAESGSASPPAARPG